MGVLGNVLGPIGMILTRPSAAWAKFAAEEPPTRQVFWLHVLPLAVLGPVVSYIATTFLGMHVYGEVLAHNPVAEGVGTVSIIVINLACFMLLTLVADALSPRFGGAFSPDPTFRLVAYSSIPIWLSGFFAQVPYIAFAVASVTGLYALRLVYLGAPVMLQVPKANAARYTLTYAALAFVIQLGLAGIAFLNARAITEMGLLG